MQFFLNTFIFLYDHIKQAFIRNTIFNVRLNQIQKIGNFMIFMTLFSTSTCNNELSRRITINNVFHFSKLLRIRNGRTTKFCNLDHASTSAINASLSFVFAIRSNTSNKRTFFVTFPSMISLKTSIFLERI